MRQIGDMTPEKTLPLPVGFVLRALQMARWDVWDARDAWDDGFLKFALRAFAQDLAAREGQRPRCQCGGESRAARTLPLPVGFLLRALQMARWDVWDARDAWDDGFLKLAFGASRKFSHTICKELRAGIRIAEYNATGKELSRRI